MDDSEDAADEYQLRLESESDAISILTVHKSKGLNTWLSTFPFR